VSLCPSQRYVEYHRRACLFLALALVCGKLFPCAGPRLGARRASRWSFAHSIRSRARLFAVWFNSTSTRPSAPVAMHVADSVTPLLAVSTDRPWTIKRALRLDPGPSSDTDRRAHRQGAQGRTRGRRPEVLEVLDHCTLAPPPFRVLQCCQCLRSTAPVHVNRGGKPSCYSAALLRAASGLAVASSGQGSRWGLAGNRSSGPHPTKLSRSIHLVGIGESG
jgi:hypothetical protein